MAIYVSHDDTLAPATAPRGDDLLNAYHSKGDLIRGEAKQQAPSDAGYNPFAIKSDTQEGAQQEHLSNLQQFLAPVAMNHHDDNADYTDAKHNRYMENMQKDPVFKEIGDEFHDFVSTLRDGIDQGHITQEDGIQMLSQYGEERLDPILHKHHGAHSESHKTSLMDIDESDLPIIMKKRGAK